MPISVWMVMVVIIEHHMAHVTRPNTNTPILVWMVVIIEHHMAHTTRPNTKYAELSMDGYGCHHQTSYLPCQDPKPICRF